ncbi:MAG: transposase domain-containing protein, partial [Alteromonas sp.]|nr:transposase domain-containing protein [Alteromonas sp.]
MSLLTNLDETFSHAEDLNAIDKLMSFVDPELLQQAYELSGVATVRRRRLPLDSVVLTIVGMSLFRNDPVWDIANKLNVSLPGKNRFVAPSAVVQARQRLGDDAVGHVFKLMAQRA